MLGLRPYKACDAEYIVSWIKDELSFRKWCADRYESYPITAEDMNDHYNSLAYADNFYPFTAFDENGVAGHMIMRFTDEAKTVIRFGFIIVDNRRRGTGLGRQMLELAVKYAFDILGAEKITLGVFENNIPAYNCYRSVGFKVVETAETECYRVFGEDWKCREMELARKTR